VLSSGGLGAGQTLPEHSERHCGQAGRGRAADGAPPGLAATFCQISLPQRSGSRGTRSDPCPSEGPHPNCRWPCRPTAEAGVPVGCSAHGRPVAGPLTDGSDLDPKPCDVSPRAPAQPTRRVIFGTQPDVEYPCAMMQQTVEHYQDAYLASILRSPTRPTAGHVLASLVGASGERSPKSEQTLALGACPSGRQVPRQLRTHVSRGPDPRDTTCGALAAKRVTLRTDQIV
jgi:hypothetical protein